MGMRDEIQSELTDAFNDDLADAVDTFTCERKEFISSDPATGNDVYNILSYGGRGVLLGSWSNDLVKPIDYLSTDSKAVLLRNEVISSEKIEVQPIIGDIWVIRGNKYRVMSVQSEPSKSIWTVQLRSV